MDEKTRAVLKRRFLAKIEKTGGCHIWTGARMRRKGVEYAGYVRVPGGKTRTARAAAWYLKHRAWPAQKVTATCGNTLCVRPSHLEEVTRAEIAARRNYRGTPEERFWEKVDKKGPDDCWEWTGACQAPSKQNPRALSYGQFHYRGRMHGAHRVSWMLHRKSKIPGNGRIMHTCDNPLCVNPAHLKLGTQKMNIRDAKKKGRLVPPPRNTGVANPRSKLTDADVVEIRRRWDESEAKWGLKAKLAEEYQVTEVAIGNILKNKSWTHLPPCKDDPYSRR